MKTLYNKALLYQYYHSGKWALFLGSGAFAFFTYMNLTDAIRNLQYSLSALHSDMLVSYRAENILSAFLVLFLVYMMITGINKRNNLTFLTSGPYTKEEIKRNQFIFLFVSLLILVFIYSYINICIFYRERELIMLTNNGIIILLRNILKFFVCGLAFIAYLLVMDCLFSNIGMTLFILVITPIVIIVDNMMFIYLADIFKGYSIGHGYFGRIISDGLDDLVFYMFNPNYDHGLTLIQEIRVMIFILFVTAIAFILAWTINKRLIINNINKLFSFQIVEKIFYWVFSFSVILSISTIIMYTFENNNIQNMYFQNQRTLKGTIIVTLIVGVIVIAATIIEKIIRKFMKRFI